MTNRKSTIIFSILTIGLGIFIIFVGFPNAARFTQYLSSYFRKDSSIEVTDSTPPAPPRIQSFQQFTNKRDMTIEGSAEPGSTIKLDLNGIQKEAVTDKQGFFSVQIRLKDGVNSFSATAIDINGNKSNKTQTYSITFDNQPPDLTILEPQDGSFRYGQSERKITIKGQTEQEATVFINDRWSVVDTNGVFALEFSLEEGENNFSIKATDLAGNETEKFLTVNFSL